MIFNLNEQKVLSDPSGSSVFKGEKDFNDIVVNLPDNIDGHTATELNYVMHFVDSDGGYSTKILTVDSSGKTLKATATVSTSITSKAQAFYAYVIMTDDEETVIGKTNGVIVMIRPVPDEENEIIPPADADKIIKGLEEIVKEATETIETATDTIEEATEAISSKQDKLTAGENITISSDNVISAEGGGVTSYNDLTDKPTIIAANSATGWEISKTLEGVFDFRRFLYFVTESGKTSLQIRDNALSYEMLKSTFQKEIFKDYGYYRDPPADFYTNYVSAPAKNGIWHIFDQLEGAPTTLPHRLINYYDGGERIQFIITDVQDAQDVHLGEEKLFMRVQCMGNMGVWQELTGGGSQIVSGVVNANGTITFTDSDGNTFTTTGSSVIGADGFSPVATVTQTASGATVSITDKNGTTTANIANGQDGNDYVLTAQDKSDIADIVLSELPTTQGYYMATRVIDDTKLNDIAVAIQAKDSGGQMTVDEMPTRIANIPSGGGTLISKTITENGVYNASSDNADGYDVVTVDVPEKNTLNEYLMGTIKHISSEFSGTFKLRCRGFQNLETVYLPNITEMYVDFSGLYFFSNCPNLKQVNISGVTSINNFTFQNDIALEEVIMPNVTSIGNDAFYDCISLSITKLPNGVNSIGGSAFGHCIGISYLDFSDFNHIPTLGTSVFTNTTFPFYFRDQQQLDEWVVTTNWSTYADRFQIKPSGVN